MINIENYILREHDEQKMITHLNELNKENLEVESLCLYFESYSLHVSSSKEGEEFASLNLEEDNIITEAFATKNGHICTTIFYKLEDFVFTIYFYSNASYQTA